MLHKQFEHLRIRGEWFRAEADLLEFINHTIGESAIREAERRALMKARESNRAEIRRAGSAILDWSKQQTDPKIRACGRTVHKTLRRLADNPDNPERRRDLALAIELLTAAMRPPSRPEWMDIPPSQRCPGSTRFTQEAWAALDEAWHRGRAASRACR